MSIKSFNEFKDTSVNEARKSGKTFTVHGKSKDGRVEKKIKAENPLSAAFIFIANEYKNRGGVSAKPEYPFNVVDKVTFKDEKGRKKAFKIDGRISYRVEDDN